MEDGTGNILLEDGLGFYELDQIVLIKIKNSIIELTESSEKFLGGLKNITDQVNVVEAFDRLRDMVRNFSTTVGVTETSNRLGVLIRNFSTAVGITGVSNRTVSLLRNLSSDVGITGVSNKIRGISLTFSDIMQLTESKNYVSGIVKYISDTVGLVATSLQIRLIAFTVNTGDFIASSLIDLSNFITSTQQDTGDMTGFSAFNSGDMKVDNG